MLLSWWPWPWPGRGRPAPPALLLWLWPPAASNSPVPPGPLELPGMAAWSSLRTLCERVGCGEVNV